VPAAHDAGCGACGGLEFTVSVLTTQVMVLWPK
jgi:hypothetical protein